MKNFLLRSTVRFASIALIPALLTAQAPSPWAPLALPRTLAPRPTTAAITAADLMTRLYRFADDSMRGRLLGEEGNSKGVEYIAREVRKLGLEPAGDNGTFFQTIPVFNRSFDSTITISVDGTRLTAWTDYIPRDQGSKTRSVEGATIIFGGTVGDAATMLPAAQAAGKVVLLLAGRPAQGSPPGTANRGLLSTQYAAAAGILVVGMDQIPATDISQYQQSTQAFVSEDGPEIPSYAYITRRVGEQLLGVPLAGAALGTTGKTVAGTLRFVNRPLDFPGRNVVAILRGSDPILRNEYVAIGAHNDHVGTDNSPVAHDSMYIVNHLFRESGADDPPPTLTTDDATKVNAALAAIRKRTNGKSARPDSIYNGADDDGSGSMSVLEIAQYFANFNTRPKRSLLFVWHVGEEEGLFGSQYFTDHPTVPRESIVAQLNIDMIGRGSASDVTGQRKEGGKIHGNPDYVQLIGSRRLSTELGRLAVSTNTTGKHRLKFDYALDADGHPQNIYCRSDHYEYARYGIPIIFFTTGGHADYHQVTDEPQYINYSHMARVARFVADLGTRVANLDHRPLVDKPKPDPNGACQQ